MAPSLEFAGLPRAPQGGVVTTTIFANNGAPTSSSSTSSSSSPSLPLGAIIGGLLGGVFLALAAVGGWIWWGKLIEKQNRKEPRLRSAMKKVGQSTPSVMASRSSNSNSNSQLVSPVSQKSVSFAPIPSSLSIDEDIDTPDTANTHAASSSTSRPRSSGPPRGAIRAPASPRGQQSAERSYAPVRPSPLSHATHPPPSPRPNAPPSIVHPVVDARPQPQSPSASSKNLLSPPLHVSTASAKYSGSSGSSGVSPPSVYSKEGVSSEGDPLVGGHGTRT